MENSRLNRRQLIGASAMLAAGGMRADTVRTSIVDVGNIRVGHFTDSRRPTGCTVIIFDHDTVAGVDVRGGSPGTRETDLLSPVNTVQNVNAILLTGGSAFGLDAATGVMHYLEENKRGYAVGPNIVPIVTAAVLFDLGLGDGKIRPDAAAGYQACVSASNNHPDEGSVGAGAGATVGHLLGMRSAMKSGIGSASAVIGDSGIVVGAIVAVNPFGDVLSRKTGRIIAGTRIPDADGFTDTMAQIAQGAMLSQRPPSGGHTSLGVVATNARLTKTEATKVAQMCHDGYARVMNPIHTPLDGDTIFAASTGTSNIRGDVTTIGAVGAEVIAIAVNRAVMSATGLPGLPAYRDLSWAQEKF